MCALSLNRVGVRLGTESHEASLSFLSLFSLCLSPSPIEPTRPLSAVEPLCFFGLLTHICSSIASPVLNQIRRRFSDSLNSAHQVVSILGKPTRFLVSNRGRQLSPLGRLTCQLICCTHSSRAKLRQAYSTYQDAAPCSAQPLLQAFPMLRFLAVHRFTLGAPRRRFVLFNCDIIIHDQEPEFGSSP